MRRTGIALLIGLAAIIAAVVYAGAGQVARTLASLHLSGFLLLMAVHLPVIALMGLAWWLCSGEEPPASPKKFMWARCVRDAAAETLPFLQVGGVLVGVIALETRQTGMVRSAVAACIDGLVELGAKLPYVLAALVLLPALAPKSGLVQPLLLALGLTAALVLIPLLGGRFLGSLSERAVRALGSRLPVLLDVDEASIAGEVRESFMHVLKPRARLAAAFGLHLLCWYAGAAQTWLTFRLLGQELSPLQALTLDGAVMGLRTFGLIVPAAAGVQEVSYLAAAAVLGIPQPAAMAVALARRGRDLGLGIATLILAAVRGVRLATGALMRAPTPRD